MKLLVRMVQSLALVMTLFTALPAFAEQPRGVYIGVGLGDADSDVSAGDMDQLFRNAFRNQGATFSAQSSTIETSDSHLYIFGGYRIFPWLSAEGGYVDLGSFDYASRGTVSIPGQGVQAMTTRLEIESRGLAVSALGNLPISDYFELHARLGFFGAETKATGGGGTASRPVNVSESGTSFSFQFGIGAAVNLGDHFSLSADWAHYFEVDGGGEDEDDLDYDGYDVDAVRLSAIVRF